MNDRNFRIAQAQRKITRRHFLAASTLALAAGCGRGGTSKSSSELQRMIVLGIDGMDPTLLEQFMAAGRMPNCRKLKETG